MSSLLYSNMPELQVFNIRFLMFIFFRLLKKVNFQMKRNGGIDCNNNAKCFYGRIEIMAYIVQIFMFLFISIYAVYNNRI